MSKEGVQAAELRHVRTRTKSASKGQLWILIVVDAWAGVWYLDHWFLLDDAKRIVRGAAAGYQPEVFSAVFPSVWLILQRVSFLSPLICHSGPLGSMNSRRLMPLDLAPPLLVWTLP
jgi:hypothetical protein